MFIRTKSKLRLKNDFRLEFRSKKLLYLFIDSTDRDDDEAEECLFFVRIHCIVIKKWGGLQRKK